jgi:UDP-N-acetylmuramoyl-tripeptide--D-alanyl-D-alanine ligase
MARRDRRSGTHALGCAPGARTVDLPPGGRHNVMNALAAAAAYALDVPAATIRQGLNRACGHGPPAATCAGGRLTLIDDSYNANPGRPRRQSTLAAEAGENWLVLGDMRELVPRRASCMRVSVQARSAALPVVHGRTIGQGGRGRVREPRRTSPISKR